MSWLRAALAPVARSPALAALVVFAVAWVALEIAVPPHPLHADTHEDLLRARACFERGECGGAGARTTVPWIVQGTAWVSSLAVLRGAGVTVEWIHSLTLALAAMGIAIVFYAIRRARELEPAGFIALVASALSVAVLARGDTLAVLWNPSLIPLPAALSFALALTQVLRPSLPRAVPLGCAIGLVVEAHPAGAWIAPGAIACAGLGFALRRDAALATVLAAAATLASYALVSPRAALENLGGAPATVALAISAAVLALVFVVALAHRRFARAAPWPRAIVVSALVSVPAVAALAVGWAFDAPVGARYLAPALPAAAFLTACALDRVVRGTAPRVALGCALGMWLLWTAERGATDPTLPEIEAWARVLEREGVSLGDAFARLSGPRCHQVAGALAAAGLPLGGAIPDRGEASVNVVVTTARRLDELGGTVRDLRRGRWTHIPSPDGSLIVGELSAWVDRTRFSVCVWGRGHSSPRCMDRDLREGTHALFASRARDWMSRLAEPSLEWRSDRTRAVRAVYRLPVLVPGGAGTRTLVLPEDERIRCRDLAIVETRGLRTSGALPADRIAIEGTSEPQAGDVTVEMSIGRCNLFEIEVYPPCTSELEPEDGRVLRGVLDER